MEQFMSSIIKIIFGALVVVLTVLVVGLISAFPVMWIWNWMMPELFLLPAITIWQSFWGVFMCQTLFKGSSSCSK